MCLRIPWAEFDSRWSWKHHHHNHRHHPREARTSLPSPCSELWSVWGSEGVCRKSHLSSATSGASVAGDDDSLHPCGKALCQDWPGLNVDIADVWILLSRYWGGLVIHSQTPMMLKVSIAVFPIVLKPPQTLSHLLAVAHWDTYHPTENCWRKGILPFESQPAAVSSLHSHFQPPYFSSKQLQTNCINCLIALLFSVENTIFVHVYKDNVAFPSPIGEIMLFKNFFEGKNRF